MTDEHPAAGDTWVPESCRLPTVEQPVRVAEFDRFFAEAVRWLDRPSARHLRLHLAGTAEAEHTARDLSARESACCSFFTFDVTRHGPDAVTLDVRVPASRVGVLDALADRVRAAGRATLDGTPPAEPSRHTLHRTPQTESSARTPDDAPSTGRSARAPHGTHPSSGSAHAPDCTALTEGSAHTPDVAPAPENSTPAPADLSATTSPPDGLRSGQLADAAGVNPQTLRYYERRGLLAAPRRSPGGHRLYPAESITRLRVIKAAQRLGFTLDEVTDLLGADRRPHARTGLSARVTAKLAEVDRRLADLTAVRDSLLAAISAGCDDLVACAGSACCPLPFAGDQPARRG
ncbi:MerR family transcriptional regulator [Micromonospora profundi]|uniref:MerR family transcriptional regulator n=1 Tax=Micromonospora profundi TaxID=1420889 RepID=UPI0033A240C0